MQKTSKGKVGGNGEQHCYARIDHDLSELLNKELGRLPEACRLAVVLCDIDGLSRKEAAAKLGWKNDDLVGQTGTRPEEAGSSIAKSRVHGAGGIVGGSRRSDIAAWRCGVNRFAGEGRNKYGSSGGLKRPCPRQSPSWPREF